MKTIITILFLFFSISLVAQDIDFYLKGKNDNFSMPLMNQQMKFKEFHYLSKTLRMQDMLYAMAVPGYVHFHAGEKGTGYTLLAMRMAGYAAYGYVVYDVTKYLSFKSMLNFDLYKDIPELSDKATFYGATITTGAMLIFGTYMFDWIHGRYRLFHKQEMIRYKYGTKLKLSSSIVYTPSQLVPTVGISLNF